MNVELQELVKRARAENYLAIRNMTKLKQGIGAFDPQSVAMPRFVRSNLISAARRLRDNA